MGIHWVLLGRGLNNTTVIIKVIVISAPAKLFVISQTTVLIYSGCQGSFFIFFKRAWPDICTTLEVPVVN